MKPLQPPDGDHLHAAQGWLELGNLQGAHEELEKITPGFRAHPDVLEVRVHIYILAKKWDLCVDIVGAIIKLDSDMHDSWIQRSFALHELERTYEAADLLKPAIDQFPKDWLSRSNLGCACAQLGRLATASNAESFSVP
jgi:predicted Zn-dependent protease